ncbi:hypothetical protein UFOVP996_45 [uncultured Caudovirales phage]|jgi:homoserine dehydrogenase|uniref:Uncharacterized protein n=1 Tax=uncultured Caudovirales phage TaxID=2100421 RepID=A0A6J5Q8C6_9CAUD|nr:hypothetical protein UFOVP996_45 [uncultured Caudovirales phage]
MNDEIAQKAIDFIRDNAPAYAKAKAERTYVENALKSKKAVLMADSDANSLGAKEMYAYAHADYVELLMGLKAAVAIEEETKWLMEAAKLRFEHWKTVQFNNRVEARAMS